MSARLSPRHRRLITQTTGAQVKLAGEIGKVVGHYDDDIIYVDFGNGVEQVYTEDLELIEGTE